MNRGLDLNALRVFSIVCQDGSMSSAARRLHITQPAVSAIVQRLEKNLGVQLFERDTRPLRLTNAGRILKDRVSEIDIVLNRLSQDIHIASNTSVPNIRLACADPVSVCIGPYLVENLIPRIDHITMTTGQTFEICKSLVRNQVDIVIAADSMRYVNSVNLIPLFSEDYLVLTPEILDCNVQTMDDLFHLPNNLLFVAGNFRTYDTLQTLRIFRYYELYEPAKTRLELETESILMHLVGIGQGWGILSPMEIWKNKDYFQGIKIHSLEPLKQKRTVYLLYKEASFQLLAKEIAQLIKRILQNQLLPAMASYSQQLAESIQISDR